MAEGVNVIVFPPCLDDLLGPPQKRVVGIRCAAGRQTPCCLRYIQLLERSLQGIIHGSRNTDISR
jgi:hypothetical protein